MTHAAERAIALITGVVVEVREASSAEIIDVKTIRALCLERVPDDDPYVRVYLSGIRGLVCVSITMAQLPHLVTANDDRGLNWTFVKTKH